MDADFVSFQGLQKAWKSATMKLGMAKKEISRKMQKSDQATSNTYSDKRVAGSSSGEERRGASAPEEQ